MAYLGILEGNRLTARMTPRPPPYGTLASSRYRQSVGPVLLGSDIPESVYAAAKAASNAAADAARAEGRSGFGIAAAGKAANDKVIADWRASLPTGTVAPPPFETTPSAGTKTQDELRNYYNVPAPIPVSTPTPVPTVPDKVTQEDLRTPAANAPSDASSGKSMLVPIAAIAAAYFFLKG